MHDQRNKYDFDLSEPSALVFDNYMKPIRGIDGRFLKQCKAGSDFIGYSNDDGALIVSSYGSIMNGGAFASVPNIAAAIRNDHVEPTVDAAFWMIGAVSGPYLKVAEFRKQRVGQNVLREWVTWIGI